MPAFVTDGVVESGYIHAEPRLHEAVRFRYRPCTHAERQRYLVPLSGIERLDKRLEATDAAYARVIAERIVEWDLKDRDGRAVPINVKSAERLHSNVFNRLADIALGAVPSDVDPEAGGATGETAEQLAEGAEKN